MHACTCAAAFAHPSMRCATARTSSACTLMTSLPGSLPSEMRTLNRRHAPFVPVGCTCVCAVGRGETHACRSVLTRRHGQSTLCDAEPTAGTEIVLRLLPWFCPFAIQEHGLLAIPKLGRQSSTDNPTPGSPWFDFVTARLSCSDTGPCPQLGISLPSLQNTCHVHRLPVCLFHLAPSPFPLACTPSLCFGLGLTAGNGRTRHPCQQAWIGAKNQTCPPVVLLCHLRSHTLCRSLPMVQVAPACPQEVV